MTTPAETLRSAAARMREAADKAPAAPWRVEQGHLGGMRALAVARAYLGEGN